MNKSLETHRRIFLNRYFFLMMLLGAGVLICSIFAEEIFKKAPCALCKLQRIPFALLAANAMLGLLSSWKEGFLRVAQICLVLGVMLGVIHFATQVGIVPEFCFSQRGFTSQEDFLRALQTPKCSEITWSILGIPVSLLSAIVNGLTLGWSIVWNRKKRLRNA